ncbi:MAG TPA: PIG-L family deacetylase [Candidatus Udaeobacter sp.]
MLVPAFTSGSRLLLFAPHPDDESLACGILLQRAVRAGAAVRVVYVTDGDDNPWPQRVLERKWHLNATDRKRWGRLRRTEALAALRVLGANGSAAHFLALPDQKLTAMLVSGSESLREPRSFRGCQSAIERFAAIIADWRPTDLLVPSISDTHPDHSALAIMLRLALSESFSDPMATGQMAVWSYVVHGGSLAFFDRAATICQSYSEGATKLRAIRCHKTQLKLSRKRFLAYAGRPERLVKLGVRDEIIADGPITSVFRLPHLLRVALRLSPKAMRMSEPALFVLGRDEAGALRCVTMRVPARSSGVEMLDSASLNYVAGAQYCGNAFAGQLHIPRCIFSSASAIFVKLERRSWFFDEAGWVEIPPAESQPIPEQQRDEVEAGLVTIR